MGRGRVRGKVRSCLVLVLLVVAAPLAQAQDEPVFEHTDPAAWEELSAAERAAWQAVAQAGLVVIAGNTQITALSGSALVVRRSKLQQVEIEAGGTYARASFLVARDRDGSGTLDGWDEIAKQSMATSESWRLQSRYDRFLGQRHALYLTGLIGGDEPTGTDFVGGVQGGYSHLVLDGRVHDFVAELGYDFRYEHQVAGEHLAIHSVRSFLGYTGTLSPATTVSGSVEGLFNLNALNIPGRRPGPLADTRVRLKVGIVTKLLPKVGFGFDLQTSLDTMPPPLPPLDLPYGAGFNPLAKEADTRAEAKLIINFL